MTKGEWQHGPQPERSGRPKGTSHPGWVQDPDGGWHQSEAPLPKAKEGMGAGKGCALFALLALLAIIAITFLGKSSATSREAGPANIGTTGANPAAASTTSGPYTIAENNFLHSLPKTAPAVATNGAAVTLPLAHAICDLLNAGATVNDVDAQLLKNDTKNQFDPTDLGALVTTSVVTLCPSHTSEIAP